MTAAGTRRAAPRFLGVGLALAALAASGCAHAGHGRCRPGTRPDRKVDVDVVLVFTSGEGMSLSRTRVEFGDVALRAELDGLPDPAPAAVQFFRASVPAGHPQKLVVTAEFSSGRFNHDLRAIYKVPGLTDSAVIRVTLGSRQPGGYVMERIKVDVDGRELVPFDLAPRKWSDF